MSINEGFIGKEAEIVISNNKQLIGLKGKIVDETKNSFKLLVDRRTFKEFKIILKKGNAFKIGSKMFDGNTISKRFEERIKG